MNDSYSHNKHLTHQSSASQMLHMHASRSGPVLSNEIILSIKESIRNPNLKTIVGVQPPGATVEKFLTYWLGGLPDAVAAQIAKNVYGNRGRDELVKFLCTQADAVSLSPTTFIDQYFLPIYGVYESELNALGINDTVLQKIRSLEIDRNLSTVMTQCSVVLINTVLASRNYPLIRIVSVDEDIQEKYKTFEHIDLALMERIALNNIEKKTRQYRHAFDFIAKELRPYIKCPNAQQLQKMLIRFHTNPSHKQLLLSGADIIAFYDHKLSKDLPYDCYLAGAESAYKASVIHGAGEPCYITGVEMVKVMFEMAAKSDDSYLGAQKFMRNFDYSLYDRLCEDFPSLEVQFSAFTTWDTDEFPEFDTNFVCALKYLLPS